MDNLLQDNAKISARLKVAGLLRQQKA